MNNFALGQTKTINLKITPEMVESFVKWSGDNAPLHTSDEFARDNGFKGKVVHGAALFSLVSQFVGVHFPGFNSLWLKADVKFHQPCYAPAQLSINGEITMLSPVTSSLILDINVHDEHNTHLLSVKSYHKIISPGQSDENQH